VALAVKESLSEIMKTRIARQDDLKRIKECVDSAYKHYETRMGTKPGPMLTEYEKAIENNITYVIEEDKIGIIGVLILITSKTTCLLENIAIQPSVQGKGYGKVLLQLAEQTAEELGYEYIELYTNEMMHENIILYKKINYQIFKYVQENGYNRVYMRKLLKY